MKITRSQLRKLIKEEKNLSEIRLIFEERAIKNHKRITDLSTLNEIEIDLPGVHIKTEWEKWGAISGISAGAMATAVAIAAMFAGWEGIALVLVPLVIPIAASPMVMAIAAGIALRFKPIRKIMAWIFKKFIGKENINKISEGVSLIINKMVENSNGELSKEKAMELYGKIAGEISQNPAFNEKIKELQGAIKWDIKENIAMISAELDDLVEDIIKRDILQVSEKGELDSLSRQDDIEEDYVEEEEPLAMVAETTVRVTRSQLKQIITEQLTADTRD